MICRIVIDSISHLFAVQRKQRLLLARQAMRNRSITYPKLAARTGLRIGTLRNVLCGTSESAAARRAIERVLRLKIWRPDATNTTE